MWRLRRAEPGDLPALGELERLCFSDAWSEGAIASHMRSDTGYTLLCEEDGAPIGALFLSCLPPEGEVYRLCVLPALLLSVCSATLCQSLIYCDIIKKRGAKQ